MKNLLLSAALYIPVFLPAQNVLTSSFVEGGKTLVELIKAIRTGNPHFSNVSNNYVDSCSTKKLADISFINKINTAIEVSLFKRTGDSYDTHALSLKLAPLSQENLFEVKAGIYKYKVEAGENGKRSVLQEGEIKLQPCDRTIRVIKG